MENALRALLIRTLAPTRIASYSHWVMLNAAARAPLGDAAQRGGVAEALRVEPRVVDDALDDLRAEGLVEVDGSLTTLGTAELSSARSSVAATTALLVDGLDDHEQEIARGVLDHIRLRADELLRGAA